MIIFGESRVLFSGAEAQRGGPACVKTVNTVHIGVDGRDAAVIKLKP
jgi:hypothetical protein